MKKGNPNLVLTLFCVILGIFIATQMKLKVESYAPVTIKSLQVTKNEIKNINNEIAELNKAIIQKQEELEMLERISKGDENIIDILTADLIYNMNSSGYTAVEGPGIVITMYDNPNEQIMGFDINDDVIHDVDILNILNDLRISGAEAISINDERVVSTSEIKCGGPIIKINDKSLGTPFVIKAIGDPKLLMAAVNAPGTYGDTLKSVYYIGFEPTIEDRIRIPGYTGRFIFNYAKQKGEGDL